ncbi:succinate dehydrogenase, hydrophobic membrane anchor protein [Erythrobacter alti]|uniref:succinate dehydrogenase, hydrophobic membrane anchor protein n=1 Tax=Erythrobacter alti TaxID=1896145 RepID=UPI0030F4017D
MGNGTSIGRVRGLGSAHEGPHHWLVQRFTAVGNLVTVLFLFVSLVMLPDLQHATVAGWIAEPIPAFMMALLVVTTFWHARLGLQVLIEDYVHEAGSKFAVLLILNLLTFAGAGFGLFSIARLAFGAGAS